MSRTDEEKWNLRYSEGAYSQRTHPSAWLSEWLPQIHSASIALRAADIGCGAGRNAMYLARSGWSVTAVDISQVALDRLALSAAEEELSIVCTQADLEGTAPLPPTLCHERHYGLVIMMRYTNLPLIDAMKSTLSPGGYLMVELHLRSDADVVGPGNPAFRVAPGALAEAAAGLEIVEYREGIVEEVDGRQAALAQLLAQA